VAKRTTAKTLLGKKEKTPFRGKGLYAPSPFGGLGMLGKKNAAMGGGKSRKEDSKIVPPKGSRNKPHARVVHEKKKEGGGFNGTRWPQAQICPKTPHLEKSWGFRDRNSKRNRKSSAAVGKPY